LNEFKVVNCSKQVEAQSKSLSAIAVSLTQDPKDLQVPKNMFNQSSFPSQRTISLLLLFRQRMIFGFLERRLAIFVKLCQALVTRIGQDPNVFRQVEFRILEKLKVMFAARAKASGHDFSGLLVGNQLRFLGVASLFAAVMPCLAFFGRSTGCSLACTRTTVKTVSLGWRAFLPGSRNFFEWTRTSSTLRIVRQTVASLTP
jgi:hypothetical protein